MTKVVLVDRRKLKKMKKSKNIFCIKARELNYSPEFDTLYIRYHDKKIIYIDRRVIINIYEAYNLKFIDKEFCPNISYSDNHIGYYAYGYIVFNSKKEYATWKLKNE